MAKFCKNCGNELNEGQEVCLNCGVKVENKTTQNSDTKKVEYCSNCGAEINPGQDICLKCGVRVSKANSGAKSKMAAGLLGIFLGGFGVHNFYLGYTGKAITQLVLTIVGYILCCVVVGIFLVIGIWIWSLVEAIMILTGKINVDGKGNPLAD